MSLTLPKFEPYSKIETDQQVNFSDFSKEGLHIDYPKEMTQSSLGYNLKSDTHNDYTSKIPVERYKPLVDLPPKPIREFFDVRQKWEGYVLEVGEDSFLARLIPLKGDETELEAEIVLEEIDLEDRDLLEAGAVFYWNIGYLDRPDGRRSVSQIRFRRLPAWTKHEQEKAQEEASRLMKLFEDK